MGRGTHQTSIPRHEIRNRPDLGCPANYEPTDEEDADRAEVADLTVDHLDQILNVNNTQAVAMNVLDY